MQYMSAHQMVTLPTRFKFHQNSKLLGHINGRRSFMTCSLGLFIMILFTTILPFSYLKLYPKD